MNKLLVVFLSLLIGIAGLAKESYLNIDADLFESKEKQNKLYFEGNVRLTKNKDLLTSKKLVINTKPSKSNPEKKVPKDYVATGNVEFTVHTNDNILKGKGEQVFYYPDEQKYIIVGNGYLEDTKEGKKIRANKIYIDEKTGYTKIDGKKNQPAKFSIKLEDNKEDK